MVRFIIYTCVTNGYDRLKPVCATESEETFVCFTDSPRAVPQGWDVRPLESPHRMTNGHDINRYHKMFPHRLFPDNRFSIYVDGNVWYQGGYTRLIERLRTKDAGLGAFRHPEGRNVFEESEACVRLNKLHRKESVVLERQLRCYENEGFDLTTLITANYLLVRDHSHPMLDLTMSLWWSQIFQFTGRDQLSLNYVLWRTGLPWVWLDDEPGVVGSDVCRYRHKRAYRKRIASGIRKVRLVLSAGVGEDVNTRTKKCD